ncbi:MAG: DUF2569 family protein [Mesorhizobium sp.]|uniref:DUF2569 family protein n=1 Tax=Mesorhizobium sp. TaxID=1871066 RepID=UPI000FE78C15|nr:DUF2569 family protein [Mesorhizobium sp.]RWC39371.1 MAG: DUF2569 family protein [Mesorhizobium sp.]RWE07474.1 MAG: DUF2569 family protein [Mesorhizobium sp.]RWF04452.1 MAG: DUF2569 family protein [Mesorhizobium sp.]
MGVSIWHWAILFLLISVPVFVAVLSATKPSQNPAGIVGFGGWLMLLAILQALSKLGALVALGSSSDGYQQLMALPNGSLAVFGEVALLLAFLVLQVVVFVAMLRRRYRFKQLFLYQWFAIPIVFILDTVWISAVLGVPMSQMLAGGALAAPIVSFVLTGIWVAYAYKSVRVRNTFTKTVASGQVASVS